MSLFNFATENRHITKYTISKHCKSWQFFQNSRNIHKYTARSGADHSSMFDRRSVFRPGVCRCCQGADTLHALGVDSVFASTRSNKYKNVSCDTTVYYLLKKVSNTRLCTVNVLSVFYKRSLLCIN